MTTPLDDVSTTVLEVADALRTAEETLVGIPQPTATYQGLTVDDAYRVQGINIARRLDAGARIVGHKVGLTSKAMQQQLGVDQPDFGKILDDMVIADGAEFAVDTLLAPRVEPEFAFRIGTDLAASPTLEELTAAIDGVAVSLEVIDSRVAEWKIGLVDTVADNASSARIVVGGFLPATPELLASLPDTVITLTRDADVVGSGPGSAVLGDPLVSLHWLATAIGAYGDSFSAGDVVLAGSVSAAAPLTAGSAWEATAPGFTPVRFTSI